MIDLDDIEQAARSVADAELFADDGALYAYHGEQCGRIGGDETLDYLAELIVVAAHAAGPLIARIRDLEHRLAETEARLTEACYMLDECGARHDAARLRPTPETP